jgi:hypothetical protein
MGRAVRVVTAVAASLTVIAAAAGSASANATFKTCPKAPKVEGKYVGHFLDKQCTEPATPAQEAEGKKNKYELGEWDQGKSIKFKGKMGSSTFTGHVKGFGPVGVVPCEKGNLSGEVTGPDTVAMVLKFEKCEAGGEVIVQEGQPAGDFVTNTLRGEIGDATQSGTGVAMMLAPASAGEPLAEFVFFEDRTRWEGSFLGEVKADINAIVKESELVFATNAGGEQVIKAFDGETEEHESLWNRPGIGTFEEGLATAMELKGSEMEVEP